MLLNAIVGLANIDLAPSRDAFAIVVYCTLSLSLSLVGAILSLAGRRAFRFVLASCNIALSALWVFIAAVSWL
jgi:hypothetical protein